MDLNLVVCILVFVFIVALSVFWIVDDFKYRMYTREFGKGSTLKAMEKYFNCCDGCRCATCEDRADAGECGRCFTCDFGSMRAYADMCDKDAEV